MRRITRGEFFPSRDGDFDQAAGLINEWHSAWSMSRINEMSGDTMVQIRNDVALMHEKALREAETLMRSAGNLVEILQWTDNHRGYLDFGRTSVYQYACEELKRSEDVACSLIAIARKSNEVPALKVAVRSGAVQVSHARRIVSVIKPDN